MVATEPLSSQHNKNCRYFMDVLILLPWCTLTCQDNHRDWGQLLTCGWRSAAWGSARDLGVHLHHLLSGTALEDSVRMTEQQVCIYLNCIGFRASTTFRFLTESNYVQSFVYVHVFHSRFYYQHHGQRYRHQHESSPPGFHGNVRTR